MADASNRTPDADPMIESVRAQALDLLDGTIALRRSLHEWPELGNELPITRDRVLESLEGLPLTVTTHETTSGIVALLEGSRPGPTMLLRGDMDALPMPEDTGVEFTSRVDGCMHACGHDTHTAMLSSAAHLLSDRRDEIAGRVLFMFQPGEEGHHGARFMLDEGLLDVPTLSDGSTSAVDAAFALHITSALPAGWVSGRGGPGDGVGRHDAHPRDRQGWSRQRAAPRARSHPGGLRDRPGAADDDHPIHRRVRSLGRHRGSDHRRYHQQRHPRGRRDRGDDPSHQRTHPGQGARRASAASPRALPPPTPATARSRS